MNNNIDLSDIKAFVAISEYKSFTKASEVLNISRSHLSRQLKKLETELKVNLVIRTTRSLKLTEEGNKFFLKCQESLQGIDDAVTSLVKTSNEPSGLIHINCVGGFIGEEILVKLINQFLRKYPLIQIKLNFSSERVSLNEEDYHLVIRMGKLEDSTLIARKLSELPIETLMSPKYIPQTSLSHPKDLKEENCITGTVKKWSFIHTKNSRGFDLNVNGNFECRNGKAMITSALNGLGIIRVPSLYCQQQIKNKRLIPVFTEWKAKTVPLYMLYHKTEHRPQRMSLFIDFLLRNFPQA